MNAVDIYEVLVREHEAMLLAYVLGLVRDGALAEDLVQQAFVVGFHKLSSLREKRCFAGWLRAIARNLALAELRRRQREIPFDDSVAQGMEDVFQPFDSAGAGETWEQRVQMVEDCYHQLPDPLRDVCRLHYFEDQSTRQITTLLRISLDAVKKRLERARDAIRGCVEKRLHLEEL